MSYIIYPGRTDVQSCPEVVSLHGRELCPYWPVWMAICTHTVFCIFDTLYNKSRNGIALINDCLDGRIDAGMLELDLSVKMEIDNKRMSEILHELEEA